MFTMKFIISILVSAFVLQDVFCINKYSKEANVKLKEYFEEDVNFHVRDVDKPFRMAKLNLLWAKGKLRLSEPKLKSFYSDLKLHDKEEIAFKHYIATGNSDKEGLKEAELRKKLIGIMSTYGLLEHFQEMQDVKKVKDYDIHPDSYMNREVFKDKKLNKLWTKAELAGFSKIELQVLKEEFTHHQDKIDEYYSLINSVPQTDDNTVDESFDKLNLIDNVEESNDVIPENKFQNSVNNIRTKGREVKDGYDRLERLTAQGPNSKEFVEPKVQGLWKLAVNSNFTNSELESFRTELHHYEKRLLKLRNLHLEAAIGKNSKEKKLSGEKSKDFQDIEDLIKKQSRKIEKLHSHLESKIVYRNEL
uniref:Alpha-2-macroglobulin receptor-associated protein n=1 Tax=Maconellicoccus hirsutus TaxID=177089 RepID=A2I465_MACHI|nr:hypothetical protein [Maconellicoccus hirsutus]